MSGRSDAVSHPHNDDGLWLRRTVSCAKGTPGPPFRPYVPSRVQTTRYSPPRARLPGECVPRRISGQDNTEIILPDNAGPARNPRISIQARSLPQAFSSCNSRRPSECRPLYRSEIEQRVLRVVAAYENSSLTLKLKAVAHVSSVCRCQVGPRVIVPEAAIHLIPTNRSQVDGRRAGTL